MKPDNVGQFPTGTYDFNPNASWRDIDGEWRGEPDRFEFVDEATGYRCIGLRHPSMGHWSGYVIVPYWHPWFGRDFQHDVIASETSLNRPMDMNLNIFFEAFRDRPKGKYSIGAIIAVHGGITWADVVPMSDNSRVLRRLKRLADMPLPKWLGWLRLPKVKFFDFIARVYAIMRVEWCFGFDCAHAFDLVPQQQAWFERRRKLFPFSREDVYRNIGYVKTHCSRLARQLKLYEQSSPD